LFIIPFFGYFYHRPLNCWAFLIQVEFIIYFYMILLTKKPYCFLAWMPHRYCFRIKFFCFYLAGRYWTEAYCCFVQSPIIFIINRPAHQIKCLFSICYFALLKTFYWALWFPLQI
jgi:hypothetical protein